MNEALYSMTTKVMSPRGNEEQYTVRGEEVDDFLARIKVLSAKLHEAGYRGKAVVAEETAKREGHWCSKHNTAFFKKGKMRGYAHPIEGTEGWCNEEEK